MIRESLSHKASLRNVAYSSKWTFRGDSFKVWIFRSGTIFHAPSSLSSFGYISRSSKQVYGKVTFYRL